VGPVLSLARDSSEDGDSETAEIVILADIGRGKPKQVHVILSGRDHEWAILAYRSKLPLTVSGLLAFGRQRWRLTGDIELDTSFLQHQPGNSGEGPPG
jgi:hypothetical protein